MVIPAVWEKGDIEVNFICLTVLVLVGENVARLGRKFVLIGVSEINNDQGKKRQFGKNASVRHTPSDPRPLINEFCNNLTQMITIARQMVIQNNTIAFTKVTQGTQGSIFPD
jgi:hypothetical protein